MYLLILILSYGLSLFQKFGEKNRERCDLVENLVSNGCDETFITYPKHDIEISQVSYMVTC